MLSPLSDHILTTLTYYGVLDYPMTSFEIWKYLTKEQGGGNEGKEQYSLREVCRELERDSVSQYLEQHQGFYALKGRGELWKKRVARNKISEAKYKILLRSMRWLRITPFIRMIAVTGSMALKNADSESDIDVLVACERGKIFTGRLCVTFMAHLLGRRRYGKKIANRICLNYFITSGSLEIQFKDLFSSGEYYAAVPVLGWSVFQKFREKNIWIKRHKFHYEPSAAKNMKMDSECGWGMIVKKTGERLLDFPWIEELLKKWQIKRIMKNPNTHIPGSVIIASDESLVFLPKPQGPQVYEKFKASREQMRQIS